MCLGLLTATLWAPMAHGQDNFPELAEGLKTEAGLEKLRKNHLFINTYPPQKLPSAYGTNKAFTMGKVGILTFMVMDYKNLYSTHENVIYWRDGESIQALSEAVHSGILEKMKADAKANGYEILTPNEYLTTEAQKATYQQLDFPSSGASKIVGAVSGMFYKGYGPITGPKEYKLFPNLVLDGVVIKKSAEYQIGQLAQACGLDAFLVVNIGLNSVKDKYGRLATLFNRITVDVYATNNSPKIEGKKYPKIIGGYPASLKLGRTGVYRGGTPLVENKKEKEDGKKVMKTYVYLEELNLLMQVTLLETLLRSKEAVAKANKKNKLQ